jgi:hypothetical protein
MDAKNSADEEGCTWKLWRVLLLDESQLVRYRITDQTFVYPSTLRYTPSKYSTVFDQDGYNAHHTVAESQILWANL